MESVILLTGTAGLLPVFEKRIRQVLPYDGSFVYQGDDSGFCVQNGGSDRLYVDYDGAELNESEWTETEWAFIRQRFPTNLHVYSIRYRVLATIKKALAAVADSEIILVDNDFGTLMVGKAFVQKIHAEPTWNWLNDLRDDQ